VCAGALKVAHTPHAAKIHATVAYGLWCDETSLATLYISCACPVHLIFMILQTYYCLQISRRSAMCLVEIVHDKAINEVHELVDRMLEKDGSKGTYQKAWLQQFRHAVIPGTQLDDNGEPEELGWTAIVLHYVSITWKLMFAVVPPPEMYGGGPCFVISLIMIGGLTYFVAPIASMSRCSVGLSDLMTTVVFVAVGTSLPDTFASYQAAVQASDADAAIGNVTGSNSVNVFVGALPHSFNKYRCHEVNCVPKSISWQLHAWSRYCSCCDSPRARHGA
jgi:hypothetical protein